jgi:quercetin dioxygenase-like cupin family protein
LPDGVVMPAADIGPRRDIGAGAIKGACPRPTFQENDMMQTIPLKSPSIWPRVAFGVFAVCALALAVGSAYAGECPADKRVADGKGQPPGPTMPQGVTDTVRASTDVAKPPYNIKGRLFRLRELVMLPGAVVPWHSHDDRPAMIYIVSGEVVEYASSCAVPITHKAGDVAPESFGTSHWWKNTGTSPAVLISVDLFPTGTKADAQMM